MKEGGEKMFQFLQKMFSKDLSLDKDQIAAFLKISPEALKIFEESYSAILDDNTSDNNFFEVNAKQAAAEHEGIITEENKLLDDMIQRIVDELVNITPVWEYDGHTVTALNEPDEKIVHPVTNEEIVSLPEELRPQLTGSLAKVDIAEPSYIGLLDIYQRYLKEKNLQKKQRFYDIFRQGLDILDLDSVTYEMIERNPNSMSHWLPQIVEAAKCQDFFKIPKTTIIKVPLPMLQLTRLEYNSLSRATLDIVDQFCKKVFHLDERKDYFVKTGTYSSKYDFRNAKVSSAKEVRELGEYLLFIHYQACQMASPLAQPSIYGVSTTTEWVVREFVKDKEGNPCIYKGLPLHTEYRVFVDFDTKEVLGMNPYWDPNVMKQRFGHEEDANSPHNKHDYIIYSMHEETLMRRYGENKDSIAEHVQSLICDTEDLYGQWSIDIMQNGNDFWIIDMALAENSALRDCIPKEKLKLVKEDWMPKISEVKD